MPHECSLIITLCPAGALASGQFTASGFAVVLSSGLAAQTTQTTYFTNPSIAGAIAIGQYTEAGVVVVLFSIAELLERNVSGRASDAIAGVLALRPETAVLADTGEALCRFHVNLLCQIGTWRCRRRCAGGSRV